MNFYELDQIIRENSGQVIHQFNDGRVGFKWMKLDNPESWGRVAAQMGLSGGQGLNIDTMYVLVGANESPHVMVACKGNNVVDYKGSHGTNPDSKYSEELGVLQQLVGIKLNQTEMPPGRGYPGPDAM